MLIPGLVSVTFRKLSRTEIAGLMVKSGLSAIEWGGDVHVPSDAEEFELENALTEAAHFSSQGKFYIASYGSYFRCENDDRSDLNVAVSLDAPNIRVWAGTRGSADADDAYRKKIVRHIRSLCNDAREHGMTVSTEFHGGTLTDHYESCVRLIGEVECDNFCTYWQPNQFRDEDYNIAALSAVLPWLSNVHVFTWAGRDKFPLADGAERWKRYIDILRTNGGSHHMLMEFVCDDTVEQFYRDAETLLDWLR
ncbi:MAG: sugar phosphate isomerase/epimerase [Clostridia bacterium]|nr:sugar phosphate isomerase/epimerase [Clostridia bacterium]